MLSIACQAIDAEGLAHLARTGWFTPVHIRSEASERVRVLIGTRERLIRMRKDLEAHVQVVLKIFGICMGAVRRTAMRQGFRDQLAEAGEIDLAISVMVDMFNPIHKALCAATKAMDDELKIIARESGLARRLMTVPGVGPVVALSFIATLDDAGRFTRSRDVGAFLDLTPRRHQSGDMDWSGRISKCGDRDLRRLLYSAATTLITQVRKPSPLRADAETIDIVVTGPMTNLALVAMRAPDAFERIREVVFIKGSSGPGGNVSPTAEFNVFVDAEAAAKVLAGGRPVSMFGLGVTYRVLARPIHRKVLARIIHQGEGL